MAPTPPETNGTAAALSGSYLVVTWDLDTTGRRLIDEICHFGAFYLHHPAAGSDKASAPEERIFSQYVMPHRNPNPGARRSFRIKVVSVGRYRMLKDLDSRIVLKTKSELSALQDFIEWLRLAKDECGKEGVVLVCHEPTRKVLVPLLLQSLLRYNLFPAFSAVVAGFLNSTAVVDKLGDKAVITSTSLRSLCKTVLQDTNPKTVSALDRCKVLFQILAKLAPDAQHLPDSAIDAAQLAPLACPVVVEEAELKNLKCVLERQGTLWPIFQSSINSSRKVRERAMELRRLVAESGLDYASLMALATPEGSDDTNSLSDKVRCRLAAKASDEDVSSIVKMMHDHLRIPLEHSAQDTAG